MASTPVVTVIHARTWTRQDETCGVMRHDSNRWMMNDEWWMMNVDIVNLSYLVGFVAVASIVLVFGLVGSLFCLLNTILSLLKMHVLYTIGSEASVFVCVYVCVCVSVLWKYICYIEYWLRVKLINSGSSRVLQHYFSQYYSTVTAMTIYDDATMIMTPVNLLVLPFVYYKSNNKMLPLLRYSK